MDARPSAPFVLRTETELILKSRRVVPRRLLDAGFKFKYPDLAGRGGGTLCPLAGMHAS